MKNQRKIEPEPQDFFPSPAPPRNAIYCSLNTEAALFFSVKNVIKCTLLRFVARWETPLS